MRGLAGYAPLLIVLLVGLALVGWALWPDPVAVQTATIEKGTLIVTIDEDGKTRIKDKYIVSTPLSGQLSRIKLKPGDDVESGKTVVAVIQPTPPALLDARLLSESEARVHGAEAAVEQGKAKLEEVKREHELAIVEHNRAKQLNEKKAISASDYDLIAHKERILAESVRASEFAMQVASFELEVAKSAFVRTRPADSASVQPNQLDLLSPVSGKVLRVMQESAAVVQPSLSLLEIGDTSQLEVEIDVLSSDAAKIPAGARVTLEQWGGEAPLTARVRLIEPSGFTKISSLGVEEQRVNVIADFDPNQPEVQRLGDSFRVEAKIEVWRGDDVLKVPFGALFRSSNRWAVYAVENGRAVQKFVEIGKSNGQESEVLSGLESGSVVILHPSDKIKAGTTVRIK